MKKLFLGLILSSFIAFGVNCGICVASADNFNIKTFDADYELGRDNEGRSSLKATWRITADFPPNQNHGIAPTFVKVMMVIQLISYLNQLRMKTVTPCNIGGRMMSLGLAIKILM